VRQLGNLLAALALACGLLIALAPAAAQAHAVLERTVPERGADLAREPAQVAFHFNEPVETQFGSVGLSYSPGLLVTWGSFLRRGMGVYASAFAN
jgi:copper transport protein